MEQNGRLIFANASRAKLKKEIRSMRIKRTWIGSMKNLAYLMAIH